MRRHCEAGQLAKGLGMVQLTLPSNIPLRPCAQGLRVRMGVHWAREGTVAHRLHALTKHRVFAGPGLQAAQEVRGALHAHVPLHKQICMPAW